MPGSGLLLRYACRGGGRGGGFGFDRGTSSHLDGGEFPEGVSASSEPLLADLRSGLLVPSSPEAEDIVEFRGDDIGGE
jgi:hypothetical protein